MKKHRPKVLTDEQAVELKWFCGHVTGLRQEYYAAVDQLGKLGSRLGRLEKTVELIENFFKEKDDEKESDASGDTTRGSARPTVQATAKWGANTDAKVSE